MNEQPLVPGEQSIINVLNGELNRSNDNRIYLMALVSELQQENARLQAQLTEFTNDDSSNELTKESVD